MSLGVTEATWGRQRLTAGLEITSAQGMITQVNGLEPNKPRLAPWFCLFQTALVASYYDYSEKRERYQLLVHGVVVWTEHIQGMRTSLGPRGCSVNIGH